MIGLGSGLCVRSLCESAHECIHIAGIRCGCGHHCSNAACRSRCRLGQTCILYLEAAHQGIHGIRLRFLDHIHSILDRCGRCLRRRIQGIGCTADGELCHYIVVDASHRCGCRGGSRCRSGCGLNRSGSGCCLVQGICCAADGELCHDVVIHGDLRLLCGSRSRFRNGGGSRCRCGSGLAQIQVIGCAADCELRHNIVLGCRSRSGSRCRLNGGRSRLNGRRFGCAQRVSLTADGKLCHNIVHCAAGGRCGERRYRRGRRRCGLCKGILCRRIDCELRHDIIHALTDGLGSLGGGRLLLIVDIELCDNIVDGLGLLDRSLTEFRHDLIDICGLTGGDARCGSDRNGRGRLRCDRTLGRNGELSHNIVGIVQQGRLRSRGYRGYRCSGCGGCAVFLRECELRHCLIEGESAGSGLCRSCCGCGSRSCGCRSRLWRCGIQRLGRRGRCILRGIPALFLLAALLLLYFGEGYHAGIIHMLLGFLLRHQLHLLGFLFHEALDKNIVALLAGDLVNDLHQVFNRSGNAQPGDIVRLCQVDAAACRFLVFRSMYYILLRILVKIQ